MNIGLLALQGDYSAHRAVLTSLGHTTSLVRQSADLENLDGLVIPGGESTVMSRLCDRYELREPLVAKIEAGLPVLGTCAGLIFLAKRIDGASENFAQTTLGVLDVAVERNAYGAQRESFETDLPLQNSAESVRGVFIRAPRIREIGENIEVLASFNESPVLVRQKQIVAAAFHPEIAGETRVHELWLRGIGANNNS